MPISLSRCPYLLLILVFFVTSVTVFGHAELRGVDERSTPTPTAFLIHTADHLVINRDWLKTSEADKRPGESGELGTYRQAPALPPNVASFRDGNESPDTILRKYVNLQEFYRKKGDYKLAYGYQQEHRQLRDSLIGNQTKIEMVELEARFRESEQALALKQSEQALLLSRQRLERRGVLLLLTILATVLGAGWWWWQNQRHRVKMIENRKTLKVVVRLLAEKNEALMRLKAQTKAAGPETVAEKEAPPPPGAAAGEEQHRLNLFDHMILTNNDWIDFKASFEKSFPGYVKRLRDSFPAITESEERLFLLLKLKMTSKEISTLLGISTSSVKKTRNRLRKKLPLEPEDGLEDFIQNFEVQKAQFKY